MQVSSLESNALSKGSQPAFFLEQIFYKILSAIDYVACFSFQPVAPKLLHNIGVYTSL